MKNSFRATSTPPFAALKGIAASLAIGASLAGFGAPALANGDPLNFTLPTGYVTYGDANSYALQVACTVTGLNNNACPWYVPSSPGQISSLVVNGTGPNGGPVTTNFAGMDDAYSLPNTPPGGTGVGQLEDWFVRTGGQTIGSGSSAVTFGSTDPGPNNGAAEFTGDLANTWDTTLAALKTFLTDPTGKVLDPVIFFNNNQTNSGSALDQTLAAWTRVWITGPNGLLGTWDFTNVGGLYAPVPLGGGVINGNVGAYTADLTKPNPLVNPTTQQTDYVLSGGQVCLNAANSIVACNDSTAVTTINNNLGANQAAYAIVFPEMNAVLDSLWGLDLTGYSLHADIRLGCDPAWYGSDPTNTAAIEAQCVAKRLTNGYEQIFMGRMFEGQQVPEPNALALAALGLLGIGLISRRRRRQS